MSAQSIGSASRHFSTLFTALICVLPIASLAYWFFTPSVEIAGVWLDNRNALLVMNLPKRLMAFGISLVELTPLGLSLIGFRRLFRHYADGMFFGAENVRAFNTVGVGMFWFGVTQILASMVVSVALTLDNPVGQRVLDVCISAGAAEALMFGAIFRLIGWVMDEARLLAEEQAQTV
jgi:hypothetical protein